MNKIIYYNRKTLSLLDYKSVATYTYLQMMSTKGDVLALNPRMMGIQLFLREPNRTEVSDIKDGIISLIEYGYLKKVSEGLNSVYFVKNNIEYSEKGEYVSVPVDDINKILRIKKNGKSIFQMMHVYITLVSMFNASKSLDKKYKGKFIFGSQASLSKFSQFGESTIKTCMNFFDAHGIISRLDVRQNSGAFCQSIYFRTDDRDLIGEYLYIEGYEILDITRNEGNRRQLPDRFASLYEEYVLQDKDMSGRDLEELIKYAKKYNAQYKTKRFDLRRLETYKEKRGVISVEKL